MKTTLLLAMMAAGFALPETSVASEVETLRTRCGELQRQVRHLEAENAKLKGAKAEQAPPEVKATPDASVPEKATVVPGEGKTHTIQKGETYFSIAKKYGVALESLIAANPAVKPKALRPGQVIRLSANEPAATPDRAVAAPPKPTPPPAPVVPKPPVVPMPKSPVVPAASQPVSPQQTTPAAGSTPELASSPKPGTKTHAITINKEITYGEFATQHGTDIKRLNELNGLDLTKATVLAKGSEIYVPGQP